MKRKEAFDILDLKENASPRTIKTQYYKMALVLHPDKRGDEEEFKKINEAYSLLTNPSISSRSSISSISRSMSRSSSRKSNSSSPYVSSHPEYNTPLWKVASLIAFAAALEGARLQFKSRIRKGGLTRRAQKRKTRKRH